MLACPSCCGNYVLKSLLLFCQYPHSRVEWWMIGAVCLSVCVFISLATYWAKNGRSCDLVQILGHRGHESTIIPLHFGGYWIRNNGRLLSWIFAFKVEVCISCSWWFVLIHNFVLECNSVSNRISIDSWLWSSYTPWGAPVFIWHSSAKSNCKTVGRASASAWAALSV